MKVHSIRFVFLMLVGCGMLAAGAQESQEYPGDELIVSMSQGNLNFDPHHAYSVDEAQNFTAVYEGLVAYNPRTLEPVPAAAQRWEVSADGKTYTFHIRETARFSNGEKITASHFRDTWFRLIDPNEHAEYASLFDIVEGVEAYRSGASKDPSKVGIRAVSDSALEVRLTDPATHFLKILCHHSFVVLHPSYLKRGASFDPLKLVSNGPFTVTRKDNTVMIFTKNPRYWDEKNVPLQSVRILFEPNPERVTDMYNRGRIDWVASGDFNPEGINNTGNFVYHASFSTQYFYFRQEETAWKNAEVRKALVSSLPWKEIRAEIQVPALSLVPTIPGYPEYKGIPAMSIDEAKKILEREGFRDGKGLPLLIISIPAENPGIRGVADRMLSVWKDQLGVQVTIREIRALEYFDRLEEGEYTIGLLTWIGDFADPLTFLQMWTSTSDLNYALHRNAEFDGLIRKSMTQKGDERYKTLAEAEKMLLEGGTVLPLNHSNALNLIDLDLIGGWYPNPLDIHPFKYLKFLEFAPSPGIAMN